MSKFQKIIFSMALLCNLLCYKSVTFASTTRPPDDADTMTNEPDESETEGSLEGEALAEESDFGKVCAFVTAYSVVILLIIVGNIGVAVTIMSSKEIRRKTSELYLFSLVTARTMIGFFVVPARITGMFSEAYLGSILCKLCHFCGGGSSVASIYSIVAIACVKLYQVKTGQAHAKLPLKKALIIMAVVWILSLTYSTRYMVVNDMVSVVDITGRSFVSCTTQDKHAELDRYFILVDFITLFAVPLLIILYCYIKVINALTKNKIDLSLSRERLVIQIDPASKTAIKMLIILVVLFTVCTGAPMVQQLYKLWGGDIFEGYSDLENAIFIFSYSNAWINVIIFVIFRQDLRVAFCDLIRRRNTMLQNSTGVTSSDNEGNTGSMWDIMVVDGEKWHCDKDMCTIVGNIKDKAVTDRDTRRDSVLMIEF